MIEFIAVFCIAGYIANIVVATITLFGINVMGLKMDLKHSLKLLFEIAIPFLHFIVILTRVFVFKKYLNSKDF